MMMMMMTSVSQFEEESDRTTRHLLSYLFEAHLPTLSHSVKRTSQLTMWPSLIHHIVRDTSVILLEKRLVWGCRGAEQTPVFIAPF